MLKSRGPSAPAFAFSGPFLSAKQHGVTAAVFSGTGKAEEITRVFRLADKSTNPASSARKEIEVEEQEQGKRPEEEDVEAHRRVKHKAFEGEPTSEGESSDDVELHSLQLDNDVELHGRRKHRS